MIGFTRIDRYIGGELFKGYAVVAAVLLALFSLLAFIEELEEVGAGGYDVLRALAYVGMTTPSRILRLLPFITLFGGALAFWQLARRSELVVLRAIGMGLPRFARTATLPGLVLVVSVPILYEFVSPALYQNATMARDAALGRAEDVAGRGFWTRRGDTLVEVGALRYGRVPVDVRIYELAPNAGVERVVTAASADPRPDGSWRLLDARERVFDEELFLERPLAETVWRPWWADDTPLQPPPVDSLSFTDLRGYIDYLEQSGQPTERWQLAYWRMWLLPVSALLTGLLAVPIAVSGQRSTAYGSAAFAMVGGFVYYLGDQIIAHAGVNAGVPPLAASTVPPLLLLVVVVFVLRRVS